MSKTPKDFEREALRLAQMDAAQTMLFTMAELGETKAGFQCEFDGMDHFLVARRVTQAEFNLQMFERPSGSARSADRTAP